MKRRDLIKLLEKNGWTFKRAGGNHDVYVKGNYPKAGAEISPPPQQIKEEEL